MIDRAVWTQLDDTSQETQSVVVELPAVPASVVAAGQTGRERQARLISSHRAAASEILQEVPATLKANLLEIGGQIVLTGAVQALAEFLRSSAKLAEGKDIRVLPNKRYRAV
jgi:hypothetical protein